VIQRAFDHVVRPVDHLHVRRAVAHGITWRWQRDHVDVVANALERLEHHGAALGRVDLDLDRVDQPVELESTKRPGVEVARCPCRRGVQDRRAA
jgi:hypothetical protein